MSHSLNNPEPSDSQPVQKRMAAGCWLHQMVRRIESRLKHKLHRCAEDGCWAKGRDCYLPDNEDRKPDEWLCGEHSHGAGYCRSCGQFNGGIESFDFRRNGLCDNCDYQIRADMGEFDEPDEDCFDYDPYA